MLILNISKVFSDQFFGIFLLSNMKIIIPIQFIGHQH